MTSGAAAQQDALAEALQAYLVRNPDAADSLEGIRRWWLPATLQAVSDASLQRVLDAMVADGAMCVRELPDETRLYARSTESGPPATDAITD